MYNVRLCAGLGGLFALLGRSGELSFATSPAVN